MLIVSYFAKSIAVIDKYILQDIFVNPSITMSAIVH